MQVFPWGNPATDRPYSFFPIDVDSDDKNDAMMQRIVNGQFVFWVRRSSDGQSYVLAWGAATGTFFPQFGDYDGDGTTDFVSRDWNFSKR